MPEETKKTRKVLTDDNLWALMKDRFRQWPEARRAARIEYLQDVHTDEMVREFREVVGEAGKQVALEPKAAEDK